MRIRTIHFLVLAGLFALGGLGNSNAADNNTPPPGPWRSMFDGQSLKGWEVTDFAGHGEVFVEDNLLKFDAGIALTGITWTNDYSRMNYEIALQAKKVVGSDFFCGLTIPVGGDSCTLIVGGWGGAVVGISSINGMDASENATTTYKRLEKDRWYDIRVRVTPDQILAYLDDELVIEQPIAGREVSMRPGEIELNAPLGISAYQTTAHFRDIKIRDLRPGKRIVLIAGESDGHAPETHEYSKGVQLLARCLNDTGGREAVYAQTFFGWPKNSFELEDAATIVLYTTGSNYGKHPILQENRLEQLGRLMKRGVGMVAIHYTLYVDNQTGGGGPEFLDWIGGYNDYQNNYSTHRVTTENPPPATPATPSHPISRGWKEFTTKNEFYIQQRFRENDPRFVPILTTQLPTDKPEKQTIAWAVEREDGGRGFGFTGGHFHGNWGVDDFRTMVLNAIVWTAGAEVPEDGVQCSPNPDEAN